MKRSLRSPQNTLQSMQNLNISPGRALTKFILWGPTFCIFPGPPPHPLGGPGSVLENGVIKYCNVIGQYLDSKSHRILSGYLESSVLT